MHHLDDMLSFWSFSFLSEVRFLDIGCVWLINGYSSKLYPCMTLINTYMSFRALHLGIRSLIYYYVLDINYDAMSCRLLRESGDPTATILSFNNHGVAKKLVMAWWSVVVDR